MPFPALEAAGPLVVTAPIWRGFASVEPLCPTGAEITIVSYKGTGPLTNDLVGGHVAVGFNTIPPAIGNIEAGRLRAIAVAAPPRSARLSDVPTAGERGL